MTTIVYFNLQTTGLAVHHADIVSIGAVCEKRGRWRTFHRYVYPYCSISSGAANLHGISIVNGRLYCQGSLVKRAFSAKEAIFHFLQFVDNFSCDGETVYLVSHNAFPFSSMVLSNCMVRCGIGLQRLSEDYLRDIYFVDSCHVAKKVLRHLDSHSLADLVQHYFQAEQSHPADALSYAEECRDVTLEMANEEGVDPKQLVAESKYVSLYDRVVKAENRISDTY